MSSMDLIKSLARESQSRIVMIVIDGLGGLPREEDGMSELDVARTPNLDALATKSICGLSQPVGAAITPGSGPAHLALFGYDPLECNIGRGVLEALGIGFDLCDTDLAARGNFCTVDNAGVITDRRAGRISTEQNVELCKILRQIKIEGVEVFVLPVKEHRFAVVFRGEGLSDKLNDSDPELVGVPPLPVKAEAPEAEKSARIVNDFIGQARTRLKDKHPANMILLRGFSEHPHLPTMDNIYKLKAAAVASYPMYRGLAKLAGMEVLDAGGTLDDEVKALETNYANFNFFYLHIKATDSSGEDGDFDRKVAAIENVDALIPRITALKPDVVIITGDHSTPSVLKGHSWHPVPFLLQSRWCRADQVSQFTERACIAGGLGIFPAVQAMPLAMANALKLEKYGA